MKKLSTLLLCTLLLSSFIFAPEVAIACTVSENADRVDSAGLHFHVFDDSGTCVGYVTQLSEPSGSWSAWIEGQGALNPLFESKAAAAQAVCDQVDE